MKRDDWVIAAAFAAGLIVMCVLGAFVRADDLAIEGQGPRSDYELTARNIAPGDGRGGSLNDDDVISEDRTSAKGWVTGGTDSYRYEGQLDIAVDGDARVLVSSDGENWRDVTDDLAALGELDPPELGFSPPGTLRWEHPGAERYRVYLDSQQAAETSDKQIRLARVIDKPGVYELSVSALDATEESERSAALTVAYAVGADAETVQELRTAIGERDAEITQTRTRIAELVALVEELQPDPVTWAVAQYRDYPDRPLYELSMFPRRVDAVGRVAAGQPCESETLLDSRGDREWRASVNGAGQRGVAVCEPQ